MKIRLLKLIFLVIACSLMSCNKDNFTPLDPMFVDDYRSLASNINDDFQFTLFKEIVRGSKKGSNQIISPLSISMALGMLYHGALGTTREEINSLLGYGDLDEAEVLTYQKSQIKYLQGLDPEAIFMVSNALFYDPNRIITKQDFLERNANHNHAFTRSLDFDLPNSLQRINTWVSDATHGKIEKPIESIDQEDVMLILNALYFEGGWHKPFDRKKTSETSFHLTSNEVIDVDMMFTEDVLAGYIGENLNAFELALGSGHYSMTFVLPKGDLDEWIDQIVPSSFYQILDQLSQRKFMAGLPKFEITSKHTLKKVLQALGMNSAFGSQAEFSDLGMGPQGENVELSRADQCTYFKIDEKGVKAAATTTLVPIVVSTPEPIFLDRPFVFVLRDRSTNQVLFIGKIENPTLRN